MDPARASPREPSASLPEGRAAPSLDREEASSGASPSPPAATASAPPHTQAPTQGPPPSSSGPKHPSTKELPLAGARPPSEPSPSGPPPASGPGGGKETLPCSEQAIALLNCAADPTLDFSRCTKLMGDLRRCAQAKNVKAFSLSDC